MDFQRDEEDFNFPNKNWIAEGYHSRDHSNKNDYSDDE